MMRAWYNLRITGLNEVIGSLRRRSVFHIAAITALIAFALFLIFIDARIPDWGLIQYARESFNGLADSARGLLRQALAGSAIRNCGHGSLNII